MATIMTPTDPSGAAEGTPTTPLRQLWQAPVFVAGVAALLAAVWGRPPAGPDVRRQLDRDLAAARHELGRGDGDLEAAAEAARRAVDEAATFPEHLGEAHLLLGSIHLRLGDRAAPELAVEHWRLAREHLEQAEHHGVPPEEQGRLQYRLGKAGFLLKDNPDRVVERLAAGVEQADDRAEGYGLLTRAYLNLTPPNLEMALRANAKLRQEVPRLDERVLGPAKLLGGELLLRQGHAVEARKVLEKISDQAPPEVLTQARLLRARTYQDEGKWKEASELWKALLEDRRAPPPEPGKVLYNLGVCHRGLDEPREAAAVWEQCLGRGRGEEAPAAALALADLRLHENAGGKGPEAALALLTRAAGAVQKPGDWTNSLVELPRARAAFERTAQAFREAGRFDLAVQLAAVYDRLATPGRAAALRAEVHTEWARAHQEKAQAADDLVARQKEENAAREHLRAAAAAHAEAADRAEAPAESADHLWDSAAAYLRGQDHAQAAALLERFLERYPKSEHQGEGWFLLAECHRHLNNQEAAERAYLRCIEFPTPFQYHARYHLALDAIQNKQMDRAEEILAQNLQLLRFDANPEAQEKSLFMLGDLLYRRKNYRRVVQHLEEALGRFPPGPEGTRARYQLADSYRELANQEHKSYLMREPMSNETRQHYLEEHRRWLTKAAEEFKKLAELLQKPETRGHLTPEEQDEVPFIAAECLFNLGKYDEALVEYEKLAEQYRGQPSALRALGKEAAIFTARQEWDQVRQRLDLIRQNLSCLPDNQRAAWEEWLEVAGKTVQKEESTRPTGRSRP
jgi:tetratricopeptide (TPR) repeat protein